MAALWPEVYAYALKLSRNEDRAEEVSIQVFAKAFEKLDSYDCTLDFKTWLRAITHNTAVDCLRAGKRYKLSEGGDFEARAEQQPGHGKAAHSPQRSGPWLSPSPEDLLIQKQDRDRLNRCIAQLNPPYREVIQLRYLEEKSYRGIAAALDISMSNVKVRLLRAKKTLSELLQKYENFKK